MEEIKELEGKSDPSEEEEEELTRLRDLFSVTISTDYQMSKLIPFWRMSPQPGSTYMYMVYYLQKLNNEIFGTVDHSSGESRVRIYLRRKTLGQKIVTIRSCISPITLQVFPCGLRESTFF